MQAITTRYLSPSNFRGARIVAECEASRRVFDWAHNVGTDENHELAATRLAKELGWVGPVTAPTKYTLAHGTAKGGMGVHVLIAR